MAELASVLQSITGRMVVDRSNLLGRYQIDLKWSPDLAPGDNAAGPSLFTALQEQLGLKLQAARGPVEMLVIDRVQRPTPN